MADELAVDVAVTVLEVRRVQSRHVRFKQVRPGLLAIADVPLLRRTGEKAGGKVVSRRELGEGRVGD
jgi:hypothetical protein